VLFTPSCVKGFVLDWVVFAAGVTLMVGLAVGVGEGEAGLDVFSGWSSLGLRVDELPSMAMRRARI
jgi:hypothetical protein